MLNPNKLYGIQQAVDLLFEAYQQQQRLLSSVILMPMEQPVRHFQY